MALQQDTSQQSRPLEPANFVGASSTRTQGDDVITRVMSRLSLNLALSVAAIVYVGIGLGLPLAINAPVGTLIGLNVIGVALGWTLTLGWLFPVTEARARRQLLEQTTNLRLLSAREFEQLVGELLRREGWQVEETGQHGNPDGGIDLRVWQGDRRMLVQCKRWDSRQLRVDEVRQLGGAMLREKVPEGALITLSDFTQAATAEAKDLGITLIDGAELLSRLERAGATELLRYDTRDLPYPCPKCATPMLLAHNQYGYWLKCPHYASDKGKLDLDPDPVRALGLLMKSR